MDFIFPKSKAAVYHPKDFDGNTNEVILRIAHTNPETTVHWYLDSQYLGSTKQYHEMPVLPKPGQHSITVIDQYGNELKQNLEVKE